MNAASAPRPEPLRIENGIVLFCSPETREVSVPEGVTGIAPGCLCGVPGADSVSAGQCEVDRGTSLTHPVLPEGLTWIPMELCDGWQLRIPDSVDGIGASAFSDSSLESVHPPASLQLLEKGRSAAPTSRRLSRQKGCGCSGRGLSASAGSCAGLCCPVRCG